MKQKLLIITLMSSCYANAAIYKCEYDNGNVTFSDMPCESNELEQKTKKSDTKKIEKKSEAVVASKIQKVIIKEQSDFDSFVKNISIDKVSEFINGSTKKGFYGIEVLQFFSRENIKHNDFSSDDSLRFFVNTDKNDKTFSVVYSIKVDGSAEHPFLNLSNESIVNKMKSKGFGSPKMMGKNDAYLWEWKLGNVDCVFGYTRSVKNPTKSIGYGCKKTQ